MKKWILSMLLFILLTAQTYIVFAEDATVASGSCGVDATWTLMGDGVLTISGTGSTFNYNSLNPAPWCNYRRQIQQIVIEDGITSIGQAAFKSCYMVTSVKLPDTVASMGSGIFYGCTNLTEVELPDSIINMNNSIFSGCSKLSYVKLPAKLTSISLQCFYKCEQLETIEFPKKLTSIEESAFFCCTSLKNIQFPETLENIASMAFQDCDSLSQIVLPDSLTNLGNSAFAYCDNLSEIILSDSLNSVSESCFEKCTALKNIVLPDSITVLYEKSFADCSSLQSITCGEKLDSIDVQAFENCMVLTMYLYQDSVAELFALLYDIPYEYIGISSDSKFVNAELEYTLQDDGTFFVTGITNSSEANKLVIPTEYEGKIVSGIADEVFSGCHNLVYVQLPDRLEYIGSQAFYRCTGLSSITIPKSVKFIGDRAFYNSSLYKIVFEEESYNDICEYAEHFPISALIGTKYLYNQFEMPGYNLCYRSWMGTRPNPDNVILTKYIDEIIEENGWMNHNYSARIRDVYDWICRNVYYVYTASTPYSSAVGALLDGAASCAGYAEAYKLFMDRLGVECQFIEGKCTGIYGTVDHMWNLVYGGIGGIWYHVDATDTQYGDYSTFYKTDYELQMVGHTWNDSKYPHEYETVVIEPTCKRQGYTIYKCTTCEDYYFTDYTEMTDHTVEMDEAVEPTCVKSGKTEGSHCSVCNTVLKPQETIPALGHTYSTPTFEWSSDYSKVTAKFTCSLCDDVQSVNTLISSEEKGEIITYTATVKLNGQTYQDVKEIHKEKSILGDVDSDSSINSSDALIVLKIAASLITPTEEQRKVADVDGNGKIDSSDALLILKYAAGLITEL